MLPRPLLLLCVVATAVHADDVVSVPKDLMRFILGCQRVNPSNEGAVPVYSVDIDEKGGTTSQKFGLLNIEELGHALRQTVDNEAVVQQIMAQVQETVRASAGGSKRRGDCHVENKISIAIPPQEVDQFNDKLRQMEQQNNFLLLEQTSNLFTYKLRQQSDSMEKLLKRKLKQIDDKLNLILQALGKHVVTDDDDDSTVLPPVATDESSDSGSTPSPALEEKPSPALEAKPSPALEAKPSPALEAKPSPAPEEKPGCKCKDKTKTDSDSSEEDDDEPQPESEPEPQPESEPEPQPESEPEPTTPNPEPEPEPASENSSEEDPTSENSSEEDPASEPEPIVTTTITPVSQPESEEEAETELEPQTEPTIIPQPQPPTARPTPRPVPVVLTTMKINVDNDSGSDENSTGSDEGDDDDDNNSSSSSEPPAFERVAQKPVPVYNSMGLLRPMIRRPNVPIYQGERVLPHPAMP